MAVSRIVLRLILLSLCAIPAVAQELFPRFTIGGGLYYGEFSTELRVDVPETETAPAVGTELLLERDLGLDPKEEVYRLTMQWRPFERHEFGLAFFSSDRQGLFVLERNIRIEDSTYPIRAEVATEFSLDYGQLTYTGWVVKRDRYGLGLTLGAMVMDLDASITGRAPDFTDREITEGVAATAPIVVIGAEGRFAITPRLIAEGTIAALPRIKYSDYTGRAVSGRALLEFRVTPRIGIGAAYNHFVVDGTFQGSDFVGRLDYYVDGAEAHLRFIF